MKKLIALLVISFGITGCYTQFEIVEKPTPQRQYVYSLDFPYGYSSLYQHYWITPYVRPVPPTKTVIIVKKNDDKKTKVEDKRRNSGVVRKTN